MEIKKKSNALVYDRAKCIGCTKCVRRCEKIGINHLAIKGIGKGADIVFKEDCPCVLCGQCTLVCPVNSMREQENIDEIKILLENNKKDKIKIVQCAPSIRTSLNEMFKVEHSILNEKKINGALKKIGFDKVFDINFGADITSYAEANELVERLTERKHLPMFTSCCPSWVLYVEQKKQFLKNNLTDAFSPHIHAGLAYKTWWAEKNNINPKDIVVVSITPCLSKKHEANLENTKINGLKAVDYVLTTRELGRLFKSYDIDFEKQDCFDGDELAEHSGGAAIYGASGGVMESALRVAYRQMIGKNPDNDGLINVRCGFEGMKEVELNIGGMLVKTAVISSPINIEKFIDTEEYKKYHYVEVMNCLGGCINGGGQPLLPLNQNLEEELINKRRNVLYSIDKQKIRRNALDNEVMMEYVKWAKKKNYNLFYIEKRE